MYDILCVAPKHLLQIPDDSHVWLGTESKSAVHCFVLDSFSDGNIALVADHSQISHKIWILNTAVANATTADFVFLFNWPIFLDLGCASQDLPRRALSIGKTYILTDWITSVMPTSSEQSTEPIILGFFCILELMKWYALVAYL